MPEVDAAFKGAGKKPGLEIWRIEKFKVVAQTDASKMGKFYSGDAYIVLYTEKVQSAFKYDVHFWLGSDSSQDEQGTAAYKTVELDDSLGGAPVQHREVQGFESQQFQQYWKQYGGLKYMEGGISSGFKHVDRDAFTKRLLWVKGKRNVRIQQVPLTYKSLTQSDVFVLDCGLKIFQWNGANANKNEKAKGLEVVRSIKDDERGGRAAIVILDAKDDHSDFFNELGDKGPIAEGEDDDAFEKAKDKEIVLYTVSDASGKLAITETGRAPLRKDMLDTNECHILDTGSSLFVWIGKKATKEEKNGAWTTAMKFIEQKGYPKTTQVSRLNEGAETTIFIQQFAVWPSPQSSPNFAVKSGKGVSGKVEQKAVDFGKLHHPDAPEKQKMVDNGTGKIEMWRIENFQKVSVDAKMHGQFYQGDSYIIKYTYHDAAGKEFYIVYYWQGLDSSQDEKGASALLAKGIDDELGGQATLVRVVQTKEPDHFLALFKGKFIIHSGGKASGFKNSTETDSMDTSDKKMYQVHGTNIFNTKAVQVPIKAASLVSTDTFVVLQKTGPTYLWFGKGATGDERDISKKVAEILAPGSSIDTIFESSETKDFWAAIGGKGPYTAVEKVDDPSFVPRLFEMTTKSGSFRVEEVYNYDQTDLIGEDVYMLDCGTEIWLWIGSESDAKETQASLQASIDYLKTSPGRDQSTPIITVKQGFEPPLFKTYFVGWSDEKARASIVNYDEMKKKMQEGGTMSVTDQLKKFSATYSFDVLMDRPLPEGVDAGNLENHLNVDEFPKVFGMTKEEFLKMPKWKQTERKKAKKLY